MELTHQHREELMKRTDHYQAIGDCIRGALREVQKAIRHYHLLTNTGIGPSADEFMPMLRLAVRELADKLFLPVKDREIEMAASPNRDCVHLVIPGYAHRRGMTACGRPVTPNWKRQCFRGNETSPIDVSDRITCVNCRRVCRI